MLLQRKLSSALPTQTWREVEQRGGVVISSGSQHKAELAQLYALPEVAEFQVSKGLVDKALPPNALLGVIELDGASRVAASPSAEQRPAQMIIKKNERPVYLTNDVPGLLDGNKMTRRREVAKVAEAAASCCGR